jgi:antitoxin (DNA-binding transcriptional repressor) of toxin-antitoxin stability system
MTFLQDDASTLAERMRPGHAGVKGGHPVAKLVPPDPPRNRSVPNLAAFRRTMPVLDPPLSATVAEDRADRF